MQVMKNEEAKRKHCWRTQGMLCRGSGCMGWEFLRRYDNERKEYFLDEVYGQCVVNPG